MAPRNTQQKVRLIQIRLEGTISGSEGRIGPSRVPNLRRELQRPRLKSQTATYDETVYPSMYEFRRVNRSVRDEGRKDDIDDVRCARHVSKGVSDISEGLDWPRRNFFFQ